MALKSGLNDSDCSLMKVYCKGWTMEEEEAHQECLPGLQSVNIARGTTDPGYGLFNLSYLSS